MKIQSSVCTPTVRALICLCGCGALVLGGCRATVLKPSTNDAVRAQNQSLKSQVDAAERAAASFEQQYLALKASDTTREPSSEIREATPRVTRITLVSGSMIRRGGGADTAILLFAAQDAFGHEMQAVGTLEVTVTGARAGHDAQTLATTTIPPLALRACYRSGFMGSHYTVELPLAGLTEELQTALITASFTDGWTGKEFHTDAVLRVIKKDAIKRSAAEESSSGIQSRGS